MEERSTNTLLIHSFQLLVFVSYSVQTFHYKLFQSKLHVPVFMHD